MGVNRLQGTPWHIEILKRTDDECDGVRRNKKWCKYFDDGYCQLNVICEGSTFCKEYEKKETNNNKAIDKTLKIYNINDIEPELIGGVFSVEFLDDAEIIDYEIGKNIKINAPLVEKIKKLQEGKIFDMNGGSVKLISKKLEYATNTKRGYQKYRNQ